MKRTVSGKKNCFKRGPVFGQGFIYTDIRRERFQKKKKSVKKNVVLVQGLTDVAM